MCITNKYLIVRDLCLDQIMPRKEAQNNPIFYVTVKGSRRSTRNIEIESRPLEANHSCSEESSEANDIREPWIWSIKWSYANKTWSELREVASAKFLSSDQNHIQVSEVELALQQFNVREEGNKIQLVIKPTTYW